MSLFIITQYVCRSCPIDCVTFDMPMAVGTNFATCLAVLID
jgi:hypothetical protein